MTFDAHAYLDAAAAALDLPIAAEQRDAVAANLARLEALARQVTEARVHDRVAPGPADAP